MQELKQFNEKRAEIYWWLSSLLAKELTDKELEQYQSPEIRAFLAGLGDNESLKPSIDRLIQTLNALQDREDAKLELAADFCDLFLKSDKESALPYASMYIGESGLLNDKPAQQMEAIMAQHGIAVDSQLNEPADHIAIQLDFLGNLIIRSNELEQQRHLEESFQEQDQFIAEQLMTWVPQFANKCHQHDKFGFYAATASLLEAFLLLDRSYLKGD